MTKAASLRFSQTQYNVNEGNGTVSITVILDRAGHPDPGATVQVEYKTIPGSAKGGDPGDTTTDYTTQDSTVSGVPLEFPPGENSKIIEVPITDDPAVENPEQFSVILFSPRSSPKPRYSDPDLLTTTTTVNILDNDGTNGTIGFASPNYSINESPQLNPDTSGAVTLTVTRSGDTTRQVAVNFATAPVTATENIDYQGTQGTLVFQPGDTAKTITIPVFNDTESEGDETFRVNLSPSFGGTSTATVTIRDDDASVVNFSSASYSVAENSPGVLITLNRSGNTSAAGSVRAVTVPGTAAADVDYQTQDIDVSFAPGQTSATFTVPIFNDPTVEGTETFGISISARINSGIVVGAISETTVSIIDNENANIVEFISSTFSVAENDSSGVAKITVRLNRGGESNSTVSVEYFTSGGSATPTSDYTPLPAGGSAPLVFGPGETLKTFSIPIVNDGTIEATENVSLVLANPVNAVLGANATAFLNIVDDEVPPPVSSATNIVNVSTRGPVQQGNDVMIAGFIVEGDSPKQLVLRGLGASLSSFGVSGAISDPTLTLINSNGDQIAFDDDFGTAPQSDRNTLASNNLTPTDSREAAIVTTLQPGAYTAILRGKTNGVGLIEAYDVSQTVTSALRNISTRGKVEKGDNGAMIAGFIIAPPSGAGTAQRVIIRALGPSLKQAGLADALADTTLDLYRGSQIILSNDNWKANNLADQQELKANGLAPQNDKEAAIVTTLDPGSYTAVVRGKGDTTGVALVEVYRVN